MVQHPRANEAPALARDEEWTFGLRAGLAVLSRRPQDARRIMCSPTSRAEVLEAIHGSPAARLPLEVVDEGRLEALVGTQHEGLCVAARVREFRSPLELGEQLRKSKGTAIALDRVRNPYNVGAILRSAAFFGVEGLLLGAPAPHPGLAPQAVRVAEGGAEHLLLTRTTDLADTLGRLQAMGIAIVGAESGSSSSLFEHVFRGPTLLVLGHEREGLGERVRARCDALVGIAGTSSIESLNVGVAAGIFIAEMTRARPSGAPRATPTSPPRRP